MSTEAQALRRIYLWSFVTRVLIGLLAWWIASWANLSLIEDAQQYEQLGASVAEDWLSGRGSPWLQAAIHSPAAGEAWVMVVLIAAIYWLLIGVRAIPIVI